MSCTATQDDWQRQCAIVMSGKIRYDTLVLELFGVVISQLYAQLISKTNLSNNNLTVILSVTILKDTNCEVNWDKII